MTSNSLIDKSQNPPCPVKACGPSSGRKGSGVRVLFFYFILFTFVFVLIFISPLIVGFGKTGKNTQVLGKDYSLLTKSQIISRLNSDFSLPASITLTQESRTFTLNLSSISATVNQSEVANNLLFRRLNTGLANYFAAFFKPKNFILEVDYNSASLDNYLSDLSSQIDKPFIPSELSVDPKTSSVVLKSGELGQMLNTSLLKDQIIASLKNYQLTTPLLLPVTSVGVLPTDSEIVATKDSATKLLGKSLTLTGPTTPITIDDKTLISWLSFSRTCNQEDINSYVSSLAPTVKKDPVDATFKVENGKVLEFRPSTNGYTLNSDKLSELLCRGLDSLISVSDKNLAISLDLTAIPPKINTSDVNNLGIKDLIGSGTSTFRHSSAIRNMNVERGASIVNRLLVPPGETFSFIKALGEVTIENGYKMAYVIRAGKTELDVGGGICQVSTTFFRAILNSGLNVLSRKNHAYRVQYYEEDMPPGYDATVFIPNPDLTFLNDTGHYLLIQSTYNGQEKRLTYDIYGTNDGRKVEITNYRQWGAAPAPPAVYIDDPTLPVGKTIQDEHAIPGLKTSFDWKVTKDGQILHQKTFQSVYSPWAAVYRRGTGQ